MRMKISVVVPYYKGGRHIKKLLVMLQKNYYELSDICEMEVIIVNDSPWEEISINIVEYPFKVKQINNEKNEGIHKTRVNGLRHTTGDYICFLDQDDTIESNTFQSQVSHIGEYDYVVCNGYYEYSDGKKMPIYANSSHQKCCLNLDFLYGYDNPIISPGQVLLKKSAIPNEWMKYSFVNNGADDYYLWLLLLEKNIKGTINPDMLYTHEFTGNNTSLNIEKMLQSNMELVSLLEGKVDKKRLNKIKRRTLYYGSNSSSLWTKLKYFDVGINKKKYSRLKLEK